MHLSRASLAALFAATALCTPALAQGTGAAGSGPAKTSAPAASPAPAAPAGAATPAGQATGSQATGSQAAGAKPDPVVAKVGNREIHLSDVQSMVAQLPPQARGLPANMLYPMLLNQAIDSAALTIQARKDGLEKDPAVHEAMVRAEDQVLANALLRREVLPAVTDAALKAEYDKTYAGKPGEEEVHAEHILVPTEEQAKKIIAELNKGADFATLAKKESTDPSAKEGGGDLGWFKKGDMVPAFAQAAFSMKPGEISQTPVHTQFGWHVIKVLGKRQAPPPSFDEVKDELRQKLLQQEVQKAVEKAKAGLSVERFNPDGSPLKATDSAEPPPPAAK